MIARATRIGGILLAALAGLAAAGASARAEPTTCVIELFTSQGCAACPAADALLGRLSVGGNAITLSYPVDYWDYTGWKDTLALPMSSWRQKSYSAVRGDGEIYTPQVVVDGITHAVGSDLDAIRRAIDDAHRHATPMSVSIAVRRSGDRVRIEVGPGREAHAGSLWLLRVAKSRTVTIRGRRECRTHRDLHQCRAGDDHDRPLDGGADELPGFPRTRRAGGRRRVRRPAAVRLVGQAGRYPGRRRGRRSAVGARHRHDGRAGVRHGT